MKLGASAAWQKLGYNIWRAAVPGGWLVAGFEAGSASSVTFMPDPQHVWDGQAIVPQKHPDRGAVSLLPDHEG